MGTGRSIQGSEDKHKHTHTHVHKHMNTSVSPQVKHVSLILNFSLFG